MAGAGCQPGQIQNGREKARLSYVMLEENDNIGDERRLEINDQRALVEYIKNDLFPKVKFVYDNEDWEVGNRIYNDYLKKCNEKMGLRTMTEVEKTRNMEKIWLSAQTKNLQKKALVQKRSAVYTVMRNKFDGKYNLECVCALNKIIYKKTNV